MNIALKKSTILVFGGAGFIGSNFIRYMLSKYDDITIVNFDALTYAGNLDNLLDVSNDARYIFVKGDITDPIAVEQVFEKFKPHYVVNFAAETHVDKSIHTEPLKFVHTNINGVGVLLEAIKKNGNVTAYIQVSTDEVYGSLPLESTERFTESTLQTPNSPYAASKAAADLLCRSYFKTWGIPVVVTRCSNNYGPYQYPEKLIPFFISRILAGEKPPLYGDGKHVRDWIYVLDHCRALELLLEKGVLGEVYNIGADSEKSNLEIAEMILKHFKHPVSHIKFVADRLAHDRRYAIDSSKIRSIGWSPAYSFEKSFMETVEWYVNNRSWVNKLKARDKVFNTHIRPNFKSV